MQTTHADDIAPIKDPKVQAGRVPLEYVFYDPSTVEIIGDYWSAVSSIRKYALKIPAGVLGNFSLPKNDQERAVYNKLPAEFRKAIEKKIPLRNYFYVDIPDDRVFVAHYKKDDTDIWGKSFIYSILSDIFYNDKLRLAKTTALDGFYNVIRILFDYIISNIRYIFFRYLSS